MNQPGGRHIEQPLIPADSFNGSLVALAVDAEYSPGSLLVTSGHNHVLKFFHLCGGICAAYAN